MLQFINGHHAVKTSFEKNSEHDNIENERSSEFYDGQTRNDCWSSKHIQGLPHHPEDLHACRLDIFINHWVQFRQWLSVRPQIIRNTLRAVSSFHGRPFKIQHITSDHFVPSKLHPET